jgi:hypothetical protein
LPAGVDARAAIEETARFQALMTEAEQFALAANV